MPPRGGRLSVRPRERPTLARARRDAPWEKTDTKNDHASDQRLRARDPLNDQTFPKFMRPIEASTGVRRDAASPEAE